TVNTYSASATRTVHRVQASPASMRLLLRRPRQPEYAGVLGAGVEADELVVGGAADPVVDAAVLLAQVGRALDEHRGARLPDVQLDRVLVRPAAFALEGRLPDAVFLDDVAIEAHLLGVWIGLLGIRAPCAGPIAGVRGRSQAFGLVVGSRH